MRSGDILYTGSETIHLLWDPCPTLLRPDGQSRGIIVGDLVYLTDGGEAQVIFNLLHSYEDNEATGATPPPKPYEHLGDILSPNDHVKVEEIQKQKCYFSDGIERVSNQTRTNEVRYHFKTTKKQRSGAIIVLPDGGVDRYLQDNFFQLPKVIRHFREHAPSWYQHAKSRDVPNLKNGSLFLVRRTYSARTWGIATFGSKDYDKTPIKAEFAQNGSDRYEYIWQHEDNRLKTNRGPSQSQLRALQGGEPPFNQCIGMLLSSLQLDEDTWQNYFPVKSNPTTPEKASSSPLRRRISNSSSDVSNGRHSAQSRQSKQTHWSSWKERFKGKRKEGAESFHNASQEGLVRLRSLCELLLTALVPKADFEDYRLLIL
ncbi:hypothetical protein GALMADRAFT_256160 [Galerina marginata CBS 339.88]|uniref:Uncharacterized protein n=1 Tax=Galerina marginata (strain CBS 339.88) TaxID=685588 RepID=A0A067SNN1_GALM3|nr:hypothetical protein GALMADRAFT_256160 [Galerina marginata CBS 339.88]